MSSFACTWGEGNRGAETKRGEKIDDSCVSSTAAVTRLSETLTTADGCDHRSWRRLHEHFNHICNKSTINGWWWAYGYVCVCLCVCVHALEW